MVFCFYCRRKSLNLSGNVLQAIKNMDDIYVKWKSISTGKCKLAEMRFQATFYTMTCIVKVSLNNIVFRYKLDTT